MRKKIFASLAATSLLALTACGGSGNSGSSASGDNAVASQDVPNTVSIALKTPSWILPISSPGHTQGENALFIDNLYPALFAYALDSTEKYSLDLTRSMALEPAVSEDQLTYTVTLKDRTWNDGEKITTKDIEFWWNLINANKDKWASYREGAMPDNVTEFKVIDEKTFSITTDKQYSPGWFVGNQLNRIVALPSHAWDPEGKAKTDAGAKEIFEALTKASEDTSTYATNEFWKTVSGPFTVESYVPAGEVKLAANPAYDGEVKPSLDSITYKPFTGDDAQFNVLRSGGIDYGYIPASALNQKENIEKAGYTVSPWYGWSITYMPMNFNNPKTGVLFKQKYLRQAMQQLIDQPTLSKVVWQDSAAPTCGPIPQKPGSGGTTEGCAYEYNPEAAKKLLTDHGWDISSGVGVCTDAAKCGEGIAEGTKLSFRVTSQSGFNATSRMFEALKSEFGKAGIELNIQEVPDSVSVTQKCEPTDSGCDWDLSFFGSQSSWYFPVYASGERLFASNGAVNLGSYSDAKADELIEATQYSSDESAMKAYNDYLAEDLPVLWMPNPVAQTSAYKSYIKGIDPQDPTLGMNPASWTIQR